MLDALLHRRAEGDIGRVGGQDVELARLGPVEPVDDLAADARVHLVAPGVAGRHRHRLRRDVRSQDRRVLGLHSHRDGHAPAAGEGVPHAPGPAQAAQVFDGFVDQQLGLAPGDQHRRRDREGQRVEFLLAHQVGDGLMGGRPLDPLAEGGQLLRVGLVLEAGVQHDPRAAQGARQEHFGRQARLVHAGLDEVLPGPVQQPQNRPGLCHVREVS